MDHLFLAFQKAIVAVPEASEQAMRYYRGGNFLWILQQIWSLLFPLAFLFSGFSSKLSFFAEKWGRKFFFSLGVYLFIYMGLFALLSFPLDFFGSYLREHAYGLSTQSFGRWIGNLGKGWLINFIGALLLAALFYLLLKKSPKRWWLYSSIASTAVMAILIWVQPIWMDPLFNKFGPMKDKVLEEKILQLAARAKIEGSHVFEVDKSKDTNKMSAYVVGFGATKRIVLWDTLIQKMTPEEVLFVVGHEMGHYVLHHILWMMVYFSGLSLLFFYLLYRSANYLMKRYQRRLKFVHLSSIASLPLFLFLGNFFLLVLSPISNAISRHDEHEADRFALEITKDNEAGAKAFIALQKENLANPRPGLLYKIFLCDHPTLAQRIDFCNSYAPWKEGLPLKYEKQFLPEEKKNQ